MTIASQNTPFCPNTETEEWSAENFNSRYAYGALPVVKLLKGLRIVN